MILVIDRNRCFLERKSRDLRPGTGNEHVKVTHFFFFSFLIFTFFPTLGILEQKIRFHTREKQNEKRRREKEREKIVLRFRFLRLFQLQIFERDIRGRMLSVQEAMYLIPINQ